MARSIKVHVFAGDPRGERIEYWYDPTWRCWMTAQFDRGGNQVGPAIDAYTRREIRLAARHLAKTHNEVH